MEGRTITIPFEEDCRVAISVTKTDVGVYEYTETHCQTQIMYLKETIKISPHIKIESFAKDFSKLNVIRNRREIALREQDVHITGTAFENDEYIVKIMYSSACFKSYCCVNKTSGFSFSFKSDPGTVSRETFELIFQSEEWNKWKEFDTVFTDVNNNFLKTCDVRIQGMELLSCRKNLCSFGCNVLCVSQTYLKSEAKPFSSLYFVIVKGEEKAHVKKEPQRSLNVNKYIS